MWLKLCSIITQAEVSDSIGAVWNNIPYCFWYAMCIDSHVFYVYHMLVVCTVEMALIVYVVTICI